MSGYFDRRELVKARSYLAAAVAISADDARNRNDEAEHEYRIEAGAMATLALAHMVMGTAAFD